MRQLARRNEQGARRTFVQGRGGTCVKESKHENLCKPVCGRTSMGAWRAWAVTSKLCERLRLCARERACQTGSAVGGHRSRLCYSVVPLHGAVAALRLGIKNVGELERGLDVKRARRLRACQQPTQADTRKMTRLAWHFNRGCLQHRSQQEAADLRGAWEVRRCVQRPSRAMPRRTFALCPGSQYASEICSLAARRLAACTPFTAFSFASTAEVLRFCFLSFFTRFSNAARFTCARRVKWGGDSAPLSGVPGPAPPRQ